MIVLFPALPEKRPRYIVELTQSQWSRSPLEWLHSHFPRPTEHWKFTYEAITNHERHYLSSKATRFAFIVDQRFGFSSNISRHLLKCTYLYTGWGYIFFYILSVYICTSHSKQVMGCISTVRIKMNTDAYILVKSNHCLSSSRRIITWIIW